MDVKQKEKPLISVIVPIYNVEKYVRKCLDSLKNQTMKQIEVICIDDGSTDRSGAIADEYVGTHGGVLFRVIHTENRGLSAARNRGIDEARAGWIMFVDSDDWVDERFCEIPYKAAIGNDVDLVCFRSYRVTAHGRVKKNKKITAPTGIVDEMTAHEYAGWAAWNKMYTRVLFNEIRFPEGHVYEDLATAHKFVNEAETIVLLQDTLYYHANRKGSISYTHNKTYKRDGFVSALNRYEFLSERGYTSKKIESLPQRYAIRYLTSARPGQDAIYFRAEEIANSIVGIPKYFSTKQKLALIAWKTSKRVFYLICGISGRMSD